ncbi:MAG: GNAT family N-acetyltransferase [Marinilabiliales bacterium]|nr:MAG: GNAT family N-acetyltransferase [Marinilabiliales bacterium]
MIVVRKAKEGDSRIIESFQILLARETEQLELDPADVEQGVKAVFSDPGKGCYYVAEFDGNIAGSLLITYEWSDWRNRTILWIQSVYVVQQHRNKRLFSHLYEHIKQRVEDDPGLGGIRLYVDITNKKAMQVYRHFGMDSEHYQLFEWIPQ